MAHFAQLDENNIVINVIVVSNEDVQDERRIENEQSGIRFCKSILGEETKWVQTSYTGKIRKKYAAIGDRYNAELDIFESLNEPSL